MSSIRRNTKLTERTVTVLYRYFIKVDHKDLRAGDIVLVVVNDQGKQYTVTLRKGTKRHECNCISRKPCYHIARMVKAENDRWDAEKAAKKAEYVMSDAMQAKLVAPKTEEVKEVSQVPVYTNMFKKPWRKIEEAREQRENCREMLAEARTIRERRANEDLGERGNLNVSKAFSILR